MLIFDGLVNPMDIIQNLSIFKKLMKTVSSLPGKLWLTVKIYIL